jgi:hypothetical protein
MASGNRIVAVALTIAALFFAGCSGGGPAIPASGSTASNAQTARTPSFEGTTQKALRISALGRYHYDHPDIQLIAILQLQTQNGNASFAPYGSWDCLAWRGMHGFATQRSDDDGWGFGWGNGPIYIPSANESFAIPAFSMNDPCASGWNNFQPWAGNYYVVEVTFDGWNNSWQQGNFHNDFSFAAVAGPGAEDQSNVNFPAANSPLSLSQGQAYAFLLVATSGTLPTPAPSSTPPPACPTNAGLASPPPALTSTPYPTYTAVPSTLAAFHSMSSLDGATGQIACDPNSGNIYGTLTTAGYDFAFSPSLGTAVEQSDGTASQTGTIADSGGTLYLGANGGKLGIDDLFSGTPGGVLASITLAANSTSVTAIAPVPDGGAYAAGTLNGSPVVYAVTQGGSVTTYAAPATCTGFTAATSDASGNVYLADAGCGIQEISNAKGGDSFATLAPIAIEDSVAQLTIGPDGALYYPSVSSNGFVRVNTTGGGATAYALPPVADHVESLAAGSDGNLWFSADQYQKLGGAQGGVIGNWSLATGQVTMYATSVAGNTAGSAGITDPLYLIPGPNGALYGDTNTAQNNMIVVTP